MSRGGIGGQVKAAADQSHAPGRERDARRAATLASADAPTTMPSNRALSAALARGNAGQVATSRGHALDPVVRADMEARFGNDFGSVRIRDDGEADADAAALGAKAYTVGEEIVFANQRYAPREAEGRRLLAHELAHVVQQRRGGAPPELSPSAAHESAADAAAAQVVGGTGAVQVSGATGVGVAREPDPKRRRGPTQVPAPEPDPMPVDTGMRMFNPGPSYWVDHAPDLQSMPPHQLYDEINQINEWLGGRMSSSTAEPRLRQVRDELTYEIARREKTADKGAKRSTRRKAKGKSAPAASVAGAALPRMLRERSSRGDDPAQEYDDIVTALQRDDLSAANRKLLQTERMNLQPAVAADLDRRAAMRQGEAIGNALTPKSASSTGDYLVKAAERVDSIKPVADKPGLSYLISDGQMLLMSDAQADAIRKSMVASLEQENRRAHSVTENVQTEWHDFIDLTYDEHPYVGAATMAVARSNPLNWDDDLMPLVRTSNISITRFKELQRDANDPWRTQPASLLPLAQATAKASEYSDAARDNYDRHIDRMMSAAGHIVTGLEGAKMAGQFAASIAFTPAGAALYSGGESALVQSEEIAYGQRQGYDAAGIVFDSASAYFGAKFSGGVMNMAKGSSMLTRAGAFVLADRGGAVIQSTSRMGMDQLSGRKDYSFGDYAHAARTQATDVKQLAINAGLLGLGHLIESSSRPRAPSESPPAAPAAAAAQGRPAATVDLSPPQLLGEPAPANTGIPRVDQQSPRSGGGADDLGARLAAKSTPANDNAAAPAATPDNVVPFDPNAALPRSKASAKLDAALARQPAAQAGSITALPQRSAAAPEPFAAPQAEAVPRAEQMAVGQTHGADGGGAATLDAHAPTVGEGLTPITAGPRKTSPGNAKAGSVRTSPTSRVGSGRATGPRPKPASARPTSEAAPSRSTAKTKAKPSGEEAANSNESDPLVAVRVQGGGAKKGSYVTEGSEGFVAAAKSNKNVVLPKSQADALKFRPEGPLPEPTGPKAIQPRMRGGKQAESSGAGRETPHNISGRQGLVKANARGKDAEKRNIARRNDAFNKTIGADRAQAHGYNALIDAGEVGIYRPGNISTGGVDAITASVPANGRAKVFLNDFTGMETQKGAKDTHKSWRAELDKATRGERLDFNEGKQQPVRDAIRSAIDNGEVYVRTVRLDFSPEGQGRVHIGEAVKYDPKRR